MEILAGVALTLASFVLAVAVVRLLQNELSKGKRVALSTWLVFGGVVLFPALGILAGLYLIFSH